ncbi:MAG: hypothetical protein CVU50_10220 [Candidatus Cloacimonetes bacterium HGW-Cloacimonetes-3]|jgi:hypothetical protein|nr:MAG: hypothetical protein CVU50_10220 [Candidatus Cloacimonetes bacterium HGW-Cloacimonetes-3]
MLEALTGKVFATVASISMFLFSSYSGNDPSFRALSSRVGGNYLQLRTNLVGAFDNDFPDVFNSGTVIPVNFSLSIRSGNRVLAERHFQNRVRYDPGKGTYEVYTAGMNRTIETESYAHMLAEISGFECSIPYNPDWGVVSLRLESSLPTLKFAQIRKPVDLMVLWKYKKPRISINLDLHKTS